MDKDDSYYFLTATAYAAWDNNDIDTQAKMYNCVTTAFKGKWFGKVIFPNGRVPKWRLDDLAEAAYTDAWVILSAEGNAGVRKIKEKLYVGYLHGTFRNLFLKSLEKELVKKQKEDQAVEIFDAKTRDISGEQPEEDSLYARAKKILDGMKDCEELMTWRYQDRISYDEIALRKGITKKACIHQLWRCRNYFFKKFGKK